ncbi:MAG: helix-turn-helix domain-containing protein [Candidatus Nanoarchaeia archaeon]|nr:helix-turn-helix domain-containing protein [Candidatus Nanoarchaeia archaeon]
MKELVFVTTALFIIGSVYATPNYYADVVVNVDLSGKVSISGKTNHPSLITSNNDIYTSKHQELWILNISIPGNFSDYLYHISLPQGASVNYIRSSATFRIESSSNYISIIGSASNKSFEVIVQYSITNNALYYDWPALVTLVSAIGIILFIIIYFIARLRKPKQVPEIKMYGLTDRQKDIVELLEKHKALTQKQLMEMTNLPKASLSRNIKTLMLKDVVLKERKGMTNAIILKPKEK